MTLYRKLSPDLFGNLNSIKEEFLKICMSNIKDGVKALKQGMTNEEKDNGKNRVARSIDAICKFIDEFEGLRNRSKKANDSAPKMAVHFKNQMGAAYMPKKGELYLSKLTTIKELIKEICNQITPRPAEYELTLLYKGKDLSQNELKTLADYKFEEKGNIILTKKAFYDDFFTPEMLFTPEFEDKDLLDNLNNLKSFGIQADDEVIKLALRKTKNNMNDALDMLIGDDIVNLIKEVEDKNTQNAFVPIMDKQEVKENKDSNEEGKENKEEEEDEKLNLILSNKEEYFDLLFDLLNLGVTEINVQAWNLLTQIPVNKKLYKSIKDLEIKEEKDWDALMDSENMYKLLYSLQIINSLICSPDNDQIDETELQERYEWRLKFLRLGGFDHLLRILLEHSYVEDSLKLQRKSRSQRRKNKIEDQNKGKSSFFNFLVNYSIHQAGLYMINIIKIFIQASLLANPSEDNMLYNIISQSSTSPFLKKSKIFFPTQPPTLNTFGLLIDVSDTSKDTSSHNTPNFASPKSANTPQPIAENAFKINDSDYEVVPTKLSRKVTQVSF
jgi:hypothetical protein